MSIDHRRIWVRLRVIGFDAFAIRFARPLYVQCGTRAGDPRDWHFTTELLRAWIGTERDAQSIIRAAADSDAWDFDLAIEVDESATPTLRDPARLDASQAGRLPIGARPSPPLVTRGESK